MSKARMLLAIAVACVASFAGGCGSTGNVANLEFQSVSTGYFDEGVVNGENKIVPSISFTLHNKGSEPVSTVQLNGIFQADGADGPMDEVLIRAIGSDGLAAQQSTGGLTIRSKIGYTSQQPRAEMLTNRLFKDVKVRVFAKSGSGQWTLVGEFPIERKILTQ